MLKKDITYTDFDGQERTETFYFNLSKAELTELELSTKGGLAEKIQAITKTQDAPELIKLFKEIIILSVGQKSEDGRRFIKSQAIVDDFTQTGAYSVLFMELATNAEAAAAFIRAIIPADLQPN